MQTYFPPIKPYSSEKIAVTAPHELYIEECGDPNGIPVVVLHGGPGAGCEPYHRRFFDPEVYRIVLIDQRGCGRSSPHAELKANDTQSLIDDLEIIRKHLNIDKWNLFGGSWGATLALLYAQAHPDHVSGMILRGIFLARQQDLDWFYIKGMNQVFPDYWNDLVTHLPETERADLLENFYKRLTGQDELARMGAAKAWSIWEGRCSTLQPNARVLDHFNDPSTAITLACLETHFFKNKCFIEENQILENMDKIKHIPGIIVHGRYDMICPLRCAWELQQQWAETDLIIVRDAGHSAGEPGITDALIHATKQMAKKQLTSA